MLQVLKMLKPLAAVETHTLGSCGCHLISFGSFWPWCRNSNCGGKCSEPGAWSRPGASSSTAMSHKDTESSADATAKQVSSVGCQSTDVMGLRCHWKLAMGPASTCLVSQILKLPSSAPVEMSSPTIGLQLSTLMSGPPCASGTLIADFFRDFSLTSQTRKLPSELAAAKSDCADAPVFFHCRSSMEDLKPWKGFSEPGFQPPGTGSQRKVDASLLPDRKRPVS
mmetsp:Transcript_59110/g.105100  ORF Transcript_59110/g.105100 Transcript_59110/m.105100 type:complete len:224 (-) Transcript_59110:806-1477(-)